MKRHCGDCQLCCRLLPVRTLDKPANKRCQHQKFGVGCAIYRKWNMPPECQLWNCRWLVNDDTADLSRPDRAHYVIDMMPDFVTAQDHDTGEERKVPVVQIWCDPKHPEAHRDRALRAYMHRRGEEGFASMVRFDSKKALMIFPPPMTDSGKWHEIDNGVSLERSHTFVEVAEAMGGIGVVLDERGE